MMSEYEGYWLKKGTVLNKKYEILDVIDEGGMELSIWDMIRCFNSRCLLRSFSRVVLQ